MLIDPWTLGHLGFGFAAAWTGLRFWVAIVVAFAWEAFELVPAVRAAGWGDPSIWNTAVDVVAVAFGWLLHVCHGIAAPRALRLEEP